MIKNRSAAIVTAIYAAIVAAIMTNQGDPDSIGWFALAIPFLIVAIAPVGLASFMDSTQTAWTLAAAIAALFGLWGYIDTFYIGRPDAQGGLVFFIIPVLQFAGIGVFAFLLGLSKKVSPGS
ncbi:hypothetical protein FGU71_07585 [Erythrobacter insulae]|uniref:Uncharacterized protein n=1 Tax=Erythrobacter insulae TaxID=2584124 RepID=A0A547PC76_9SPHN|nr:hypothetical protein [Erythrobacter insulae]TRD11740.1 hypothetical protein FGU71_07585 [Erythrobacter insulae]